VTARAGGHAAPAGRQVCVVGGGLGGAAVAAFLRRRGHHPTVVSPPAPDDGPHDCVLWPGAVALLDRLDLEAVDDALAAGIPVQTWRVQETPDGPRRDRRAPAGRSPVLAVDRDRLQGALRGGLPSASLRVSKTPTAVDSGPVVEFADGVRERFDVVVGADGRRSWVCRAAFGGAPDRSPATATWSFRLPAGDAHGPALTETWGPDSGVLLGPGGRGRVVAAGVPEGGSLAGAVRRSVPPAAGDFDPDAVEAPVRLPSETGWARRFAGDGVALLGDAAHAFHPALGIGASLAVGDAAVLAAELAARDTPAALDRYERRRRGRIADLARRVAADGDGRRRSPFPVAGLPGVRDVRRALLGAAFGDGPNPLSPVAGP
jgi:2-polyprenyl-6-methoxyphenol hydroxylase-like FAD-dependent oxidoreductase